MHCGYSVSVAHTSQQGIEAGARLIAVTGNAGFDQHLEKPVDPKVLLELQAPHSSYILE
jgi:hypothetical protein